MVKPLDVTLSRFAASIHKLGKMKSSVLHMKAVFYNENTPLLPRFFLLVLLVYTKFTEEPSLSWPRPN